MDSQSNFSLLTLLLESIQGNPRLSAESFFLAVLSKRL
jgi:hypothetical protein